jgi:hypothetical protein
MNGSVQAVVDRLERTTVASVETLHQDPRGK